MQTKSLIELNKDIDINIFNFLIESITEGMKKFSHEEVKKLTDITLVSKKFFNSTTRALISMAQPKIGEILEKYQVFAQEKDLKTIIGTMDSEMRLVRHVFFESSKKFIAHISAKKLELNAPNVKAKQKKETADFNFKAIAVGVAVPLMLLALCDLIFPDLGLLRQLNMLIRKNKLLGTAIMVLYAAFTYYLFYNPKVGPKIIISDSAVKDYMEAFKKEILAVLENIDSAEKTGLHKVFFVEASVENTSSSNTSANSSSSNSNASSSCFSHVLQQEKQEGMTVRNRKGFSIDAPEDKEKTDLPAPPTPQQKFS